MDSAWDYNRKSDFNTSVAREQVPSYFCPADDALGRFVTVPNANTIFSRSNYAVCFGSDTMMTARNDELIWRPHNGAAVEWANDGAFVCQIERTFGSLVDLRERSPSMGRR